jgi:hypothetical protein
MIAVLNEQKKKLVHMPLSEVQGKLRPKGYGTAEYP